AADRVPGPVRGLGVDEDDAGVGVLVVGVGPDVEVAVRTVRIRSGRLEPGVLVGGVVHHEVDDDPDPARVRGLHQRGEVGDRADLGHHAGVVGNVVPAVT